MNVLQLCTPNREDEIFTNQEITLHLHNRILLILISLSKITSSDSSIQ